jgi:hypothetical protein
MHKDLHNCTHVFLRQDATRRALEPPYSGPYQVLSRREKTLQLLVRGKAVTVSSDRVKPAYGLNEADCGSTIFNPLASATRQHPPPSYTAYKLRSPRSLPRTLQYLSNILPGGGDVGTSHKAVLSQTASLRESCRLANQRGT